MQFTKEELDRFCEQYAADLNADDAYGRTYVATVDQQHTLSVVVRLTQVAGPGSEGRPYYVASVMRTKICAVLDRLAATVVVTFTADEFKLLCRIVGGDEGERDTPTLNSLLRKMTSAACGTPAKISQSKSERWLSSVPLGTACEVLLPPGTSTASRDLGLGEPDWVAARKVSLRIRDRDEAEYVKFGNSYLEISDPRVLDVRTSKSGYLARSLPDPVPGFASVAEMSAAEADAQSVNDAVEDDPEVLPES